MAEFLEKLHYYLLVWDKFVIPPLWLILEAVGIAAAVHALIHKRDPRSALGWTVVCLFFPGLGALFYLLFGVNRIQSRAQHWHSRGKWNFSKVPTGEPSNLDLASHTPSYDRATFWDLVRVSGSVSSLPLLKGNRFEVLYNGEMAYPKMLEAIAGAKRWIFLSTYIFETNQTGLKFIQALEEAMKRGVEVRVLVDGVGTRYSKPHIQKLLKKSEIPYALFLPLSLSERSIHMNLRTHRKIMVVDGNIGFTGGMNIGDRHLVELPENPNRTQDVHFKIEGPILGQLKEAFLLDWHFSRKETRDEDYPCESQERGEALSRGIISGPNESVEKLKWIIGGAFNAAKDNVRVMTPYFIPDDAMTAAINTAAMRGVRVEIVLPGKNNLPYVKWASQALLEELLEYNVNVYYQPKPFAHSKFLVVDDFYCLIGSANLDPRSIRLNFEFNLEVYDTALAGELIRHFDETRARSKPLTLEYFEKRSFFRQLRDNTAKLFAPYL